MGEHQALPEDMLTKKKVLFVRFMSVWWLHVASSLKDTPIALPFIYINLWNLYAWQDPAVWEMHPFSGAATPYRPL